MNARLLLAAGVVLTALAGPAMCEPLLASADGDPAPAPPSAAPQAEYLPGPPPGNHPITDCTLEDLEAMALGNNPTLMVTGARVQAAEGAAWQAGLCPNPTIGYQGTEIGNEGEAGLQGAFIEQEFVRGGKLRLSRAAAQQEVQKAHDLFAAQRLRVLTDVRVGFFEVLAAQQIRDLTADFASEWRLEAARLEKLVEVGEIPKRHHMQIRIQQNAAGMRFRDAENRLHAAWRRLSAVVGLPGLPCCRVAGDLHAGWPQFCWEESLGFLLSHSPELAAAHAEVGRARWALRRARAEPIPNVTVMAGAQYDHGTNDAVANLELGLPLPLFNHNQGEIKKAAGELRAAEGQIARLEFSLQRRLAEAFERYDNARQRSQTYARDILPDIGEVDRLWKIAVDPVRGQEEAEDFIELILLRTSYEDAYLGQLEALLELHRSAAQIEGLLLDNSLDTQ